MRSVHRTTTLVLLACAAVALAGCASAVHRRAQGPQMAAAESWATALPAPGIQRDTLAMARADTALGLSPPGFTRTADAWPAPDRATIKQTRRIHLNRNFRTLLFFTTPRGTATRRAPRYPFGRP
ncbi:MAG: hypothetical protein AAFX79_04255 [Planctomycetota bacterium]